MGFLARDKLNEPFAAAIDGVSSGVSSRLARTEFGWHVIYVDGRRNRPVPPLAEIRDGIQELLAQQRLKKLMGDLRKNAEIQILDPELTKVSAASQEVAATDINELPTGSVTPGIRIERTPNKYFEGDGYKTDSGSSYAQCEQLCLSDSKCIAIEYERSKKNCELHDRVLVQSADDDTDIGVKRSGTP